MTSLLFQLKTWGITMGSKMADGTYVGWTTDPQKAEQARLAGAKVEWVNNGWDISCRLTDQASE